VRLKRKKVGSDQIATLSSKAQACGKRTGPGKTKDGGLLEGSERSLRFQRNLLQSRRKNLVWGFSARNRYCRNHD